MWKVIKWGNKIIKKKHVMLVVVVIVAVTLLTPTATVTISILWYTPPLLFSLSIFLNYPFSLISSFFSLFFFITDSYSCCCCCCCCITFWSLKTSFPIPWKKSSKLTVFFPYPQTFVTTLSVFFVVVEDLLWKLLLGLGRIVVLK